MKTPYLLCAIGLAATVPLQAHARDLSADVNSAGFTQIYSSSVDPVLPSRSLGGFALRAGIEVARDVLAEAQWHVASSKGDLFDATTTETRTDHFTLSARYRHRLTGWLEPFARAGGGLTTTRLTLSEAGVQATDRGYAPHLLAAVGTELLFLRSVFGTRPPGTPPPIEGFTLGVVVEVGYLHAFGQSFTLRSDRALEPALDRPGVALGTMTLSGIWARFGFVFHL